MNAVFNRPVHIPALRIGINGRFLVAKQTGVQRAAYNLLISLLEIDKQNTYIIFTGEEQSSNPAWKKPNVEMVYSNIKSGENIKNHLWEQFILPTLALNAKVDLLHSPANMAPLMFKGRSIVNIHDLCFIVNPQWYSFAFRSLYSLLIPKIARSASRVITNSNNSRNDIFQYCGIDSNKVNLIYWAVDESFREDDSSFHATLASDDFILYVGSLEPRKNISNLILAYEKFREQHPSTRTKLCLIGGENPLFAAVKLEAKRFKDDIFLLGYVDETLLRYCYRKARCVVYPSLYEGFGLPPLEAMACGAPVITSCTSSLPEVVGKAALLVNPLDINQIADAMYQVISDPKLAERLSQLGLERVKQFSWSTVARHTLSIYYEVAGVTGRDEKTGQAISPSLWKYWKQKEQKSIKVVPKNARS